jgi:hypothetical protein
VTLTSSLPEGAQVVLAPRGAHGASAASNLVTLSGSVGDGARVVLQREQAGESWRRVATGVVATDGSYSFTHAFRRAGEVSLRVIARCPGEQAAASEALSFVVAQRQNPKLTISASPVRSVFGQPITISGVLAGAGAGPVTLLARRPGSGFEEVAHATTDAGGAYAFTQTPRSSTTYVVASGRVRSSALFEAVSYALIAGASPNSPAVGETVTFSGSVAPAPAGQVVYLQRRDASGLGWRTVGAATVAADGSYSLSRVAADAQSAVFRVRVPRGEHLAAASSQPFSVAAS